MQHAANGVRGQGARGTEGDERVDLPQRARGGIEGVGGSRGARGPRGIWGQNVEGDVVAGGLGDRRGLLQTRGGFWLSGLRGIIWAMGEELENWRKKMGTRCKQRWEGPDGRGEGGELTALPLACVSELLETASDLLWCPAHAGDLEDEI